MKDHMFEGKVYTETEMDGDTIRHTPGEPFVAQVKGAKKGTLAQVCAVCGETAAEDGTTSDHKQE